MSEVDETKSGVGQSNESAQRSSPQSDSDSDLLIDSSEEEDSSEENEYQADGFVVSDDEGNEINPELDLNSDDEPAPKLVLKRLKKGVKRKRHQIYQEDLDLVAEYQGLLPSSKRQKTKADETNSHSITMTGSERGVGETTSGKKDEFENDFFMNSDDDDFLADEDEDELDHDGEHKPKPKRSRKDRTLTEINLEQFEDAHAIYNDEWLDDRYQPDDEFFDTSEFDQPDRASSSKFEQLKRLYEPELLKDMYLTDEDEIIKNRDIPERFQLSFIHRSIPSDEELKDEATWIDYRLPTKVGGTASDAMMPRVPGASPKSTLDVIRDVLRFLLQLHLEMPFILAYRQEYWRGVLDEDQLWSILDLDSQWYSLQSRKATLIKSLDQLEHINKSDDTLEFSEPLSRLQEIRTRIENIADNEDDVNDLTEYFQVYVIEKLPSYLLPSTSSNPKSGISVSKGSKSSGIQQARANRIDKLIHEFGITPLELVTKYIKNNMSEVTSKHELEGMSPQDLASPYISEPFYPTSDKVLAAARSLFVHEIVGHYVFRSRFFEFFEHSTLLSTKATRKGFQVIDQLHQCATVRFLQNKPAFTFKNTSLYLDIIKGVHDGLLELSVNFSQPKIVEWHNEVGQYFGLNALNSTQSQSVSYLWAEQRSLLLHEIFAALTPVVVNRIKSKLQREATQFVLAEIQRKFYSLTRVGTVPIPSRPQSMNALPKQKNHNSYDSDSDDMDVDTKVEAPIPCILSVVLRAPTKGPNAHKDYAATMLILSKDGEICDEFVMAVPFSSSKSSEAPVNNWKNEDKAALRHLLRKHLPFAVVVGIDSLMAHRFYLLMRDFINHFVEAEKSTYIRISASPMDVAYLTYLKQSSSEKGLSAGSQLALNVGRRLLDPLLTLAALFDRQNTLLRLDLHPLANLVPISQLRQRVERCLIRTVNEVGVDLNRILMHEWMKPVLQFVSGLGPRKAASLWESASRLGRVDNRKQISKMLSDGNSPVFNDGSWAPEGAPRPPGVDSTVWNNSIGFIRVIPYKSDSRTDDFIDDYDEDEDDLGDESGSSTHRIEPLDSTRIHPHAYPIAKKFAENLKKNARNIRSTKNIVKIISSNPELLEFVRVEELISHLQEKSVDKGLTIRALAQELKKPFADPRTYQETTMSSIFDSVFGRETLKINKVVKIRIGFENRRLGSYEVTLEDNGLPGRLPTSGPDAPVRNSKDGDSLKRGQSINSQIIGMDKERWEIQLSGVIRSIDWKAGSIPGADTWLVDEPPGVYPADYSISTDTPTDTTSAPSINIRNIIHPKFVNKSQKEVEQELKSKRLNSYLIHPSSHPSYLTITSNFYFGTFAHISIHEQEGKSLKIDNENFENLDDIIARFIEPLLIQYADLTSHQCFAIKTKSEIKELLLQEKQTQPARAPYHISPSQEKPGFFVLSYIPGTQSIRREYIHVVPEGFKFRSRLHTSVNRLIAWFKKHYNDPEFLRQQEQRNRQHYQQNSHQQQHPQQQQYQSRSFQPQYTQPNQYQNYQQGYGNYPSGYNDGGYSGNYPNRGGSGPYYPQHNYQSGTAAPLPWE